MVLSTNNKTTNFKYISVLLSAIAADKAVQGRHWSLVL